MFKRFKTSKSKDNHSFKSRQPSNLIDLTLSSNRQGEKDNQKN